MKEEFTGGLQTPLVYAYLTWSQNRNNCLLTRSERKAVTWVPGGTTTIEWKKHPLCSVMICTDCQNPLFYQKMYELFIHNTAFCGAFRSFQRGQGGEGLFHELHGSCPILAASRFSSFSTTAFADIYFMRLTVSWSKEVLATDRRPHLAIEPRKIRQKSDSPRRYTNAPIVVSQKI